MATNLYITYPVVEGDTLPQIAQRFLGTTVRWPELVQLNKLRYPYISSDPTDSLGDPLTYLHTTAVANAGDTVIHVDTFPVLLRTNCIAYFVRDTATGQVTEQHKVFSASVLNGTVTIDAALTYSYDAGSSITIYTPDVDQVNKVLQPGDVLLIPNENTAFVLPRPDFLAGLGIDVYAVDGVLHYDTENTGLAAQTPDIRPQELRVVSGIDTIRQAVVNRLNTLPGALPMHPDYGNKLVLEAGSKMSPYYLTLSEGYLRDAMNGDQRIAGVRNVVVQIDRDYLNVSADIVIQDTVELLSLKNLVVGV